MNIGADNNGDQSPARTLRNDRMKKLLRLVLRWLLKPTLSPRRPLWLQRGLPDLAGRLQPGARKHRFEALELAGVSGHRLSMHDAHARTLLFVHGGGFVSGSTVSHRGLLSQLSRLGDAAVYAPNYRLAPEHRYPAALEDVIGWYRALLAQGCQPAQLSLGGDSAGGNLALAAAIAIRDQGLPLPAHLCLISPFVDLTMTSASMQANATIDPMLSPAWLHYGAGVYCGERALNDPACSPLFADLTGLPPTLIQTGSDEILRDDSVHLQQALRAAGVKVERQEYAGLWHDFQLHTTLIRESMEAIQGIADFIGSAPA